jgi:hypothetical protein
MSEGLQEGFSPSNIERIYRGEPALVQGQLPIDVLSAGRWEAVSLIVDGLTEREITEEMGIDKREVRLHIAFGLQTLEVVSRSQLAGFFPFETEHPAVADKELANLPKGPLETLQALSTGEPYQAIYKAPSGLAHLKQYWPDASGSIAATQIANALRARSVQAVEAEVGALDDKYLKELTLPVVAALEPAFSRLFM